MQSMACGRTVLTKASVDSSRINVWKGQEERRIPLREGRQPRGWDSSYSSPEDQRRESVGFSHLNFLGQDSLGKVIVHVAICLGVDNATHGVHRPQELQLVDVELGWRDTQTSARGPPAACPQTLPHAGPRPCPGVHRGPAPL